MNSFHTHYASRHRGPALKDQLDILKKKLEEKEKQVEVEKKRVKTIEKDLAKSENESMNATLGLSKKEAELTEMEKTTIAVNEELVKTKKTKII